MLNHFVEEPALEPLRWGGLTLAASYRHLTQGVVQAPLPEVGLDCGRCRRVEEGSAVPSVKCCDIVPRFSNFLVGELLLSGSHPQIERWIDERRGDPFGLQVPPELAARYLSARGPGRFGLPCPLLQEGACSIYARRPLPCVDYHCYYPSELVREAYACLSSALMLLAQRAERALALSFELEAEPMGHALAEPDEALWAGASMRPEPYEALWQGFMGREREFYEACFLRLAKGWLAQRPVQPVTPTAEQRRSLRVGAQPAHDNPLSPETQLGLLLWYQRALEGPGARLVRWLRVLREPRRD